MKIFSSNLRLSLFIFFVFLQFAVIAQQKKSLTSSDYAFWRNISEQKLSNDGRWICFQSAPEVGDSWVYLYNVETKSLDSTKYAISPKFSFNSEILTYRLTFPYDSLRKLKLAKTPEDKLPKDTLIIRFLANDSIVKIANVKSFDFASDSSNIIVYEYTKSSKTDEKKIPSADKKQKKCFFFFKCKDLDSKPIAKEKPQKGKSLVVLNPVLGKKLELQNVGSYELSYYGKKLVYSNNIDQDSFWTTKVFIVDTDSMKSKKVFEKKGQSEKVSIDRIGNQIAFLFAADTNKTDKIYDLYFWNSTKDSAFCIADTNTQSIYKGWCPSFNGALWFAENGKRLFFGVTQKPIQPLKDTLLAEEKFKLDVWSYTDRLLQPQQLRTAYRDAKETYLAEYFVDENRILQLGDSALNDFRFLNKGNAQWFIGVDDIPFQKLQSWERYYADYYLINAITGSREIVISKLDGQIMKSPDENYLYYYNKNDSDWYVYDIKAREFKNITANLKVPLYNERTDVPDFPDAYGIIGWFAGDKYLVIQDRFDFWKIDPTNKTNPINITNGFGRANSIRFDYIQLDPEEEYISEASPWFLSAFNEKNKEAGFYSLNLQQRTNPQQLLFGKNKYLMPLKSKNTDRMIWRQGNFNEYYDLFTSSIDFKTIDKISNINPQQNQYLWGTAEMVSWKSYSGEKLDGLLYKPENFDSSKVYPMIVYFYEKYSDDLYAHYAPRPSYSTINFTEYVSNGYLVFVPDITYKVGYPGKSAYDAIVSGAEFMKKNSWVNPARIGIQGQSWGGYQVAFLVTQTNIFACAEAGAPVSNMTSAYGGIRWGSGVSRAFQYEHGQSRIGVDMWKNRDLYIQNSPIFFADKVKTPLLIMSNDEDGAVPWYQGIEYFCALRRLDKTAWLLTYNNDDHNLTKYPNRVDLSIRMMQFFDHFLKEKPAPEWMVNGIPATLKGKTNGYKIVEQ